LTPLNNRLGAIKESMILIGLGNGESRSKSNIKSNSLSTRESLLRKRKNTRMMLFRRRKMCLKKWRRLM
jgi:hypothetical protein